MIETGVCEASKAARRAAERVLANGVRCVAAELRLIDLEALLPLVVNARHSYLEDIVNSSAELYFMPGALRFNRRSVVSMSWEQHPEICLGLVLVHGELRAAFELIMAASSAHVRLTTVCAGLGDRFNGNLAAALEVTLDAVRLDVPLGLAREVHASALQGCDASPVQ